MYHRDQFLDPSFFGICQNDLEHGIKSSVKFFADDASLSSIVRDPQQTALHLNHDLEMIRKWAIQWKMCFNPDTTKPAEEIIFSNNFFQRLGYIDWKVMIWKALRIYFNN